MRHGSRVRLGLLLALVVSCTESALVATQKPKPKPAPKAASPAKPPDAPPIPVKPLPQQWKIVMRYGSGDQASSTTTYFGGERQRVELDAGSAVITQCDAKRVLQISEKAKAYAAVALVSDAAPDAAPGATDGVLVRTVATDTGERRVLQGQDVRRVRLVTTKEPIGPACAASKMTVETDGWFAEIPDLQICRLVPLREPQPGETCTERVESGNEAAARPGFPLAYTTTTFDASGKEVSRISAEVSSLTQEPRAEALFEAPVAFSQLTSLEELATAARRAELAALGTTPKAPGMIRIGVLMPTENSGRSVDREALGNEFLEAFSDAPIEAVPIDAATEPEQSAEAATKECDFLLRGELAQLTTTKSGRVGGLVRRATGGGNPTELHEAKINFELIAVARPAAPRKYSASAKTGSFTWRRAVGVTRLAGRLYVGMTAGVISAMVSATSGGPAGAGDPTLNALSMLLPPEKADESQHTPEAVIVATVERGATEIKRSLAPPK